MFHEFGKSTSHKTVTTVKMALQKYCIRGFNFAKLHCFLHYTHSTSTTSTVFCPSFIVVVDAHYLAQDKCRDNVATNV